MTQELLSDQVRQAFADYFEVDLSGRPAVVFDADFPRDAVGEFSTEMVKHFFQSFGQALGAFGLKKGRKPGNGAITYLDIELVDAPASVANAVV